MKYLSLLSCIILLCGYKIIDIDTTNEKEKNMLKPQENRALNLLHKYVDAYKRRDLAAMENIISKNATVYGTGRDEILKGADSWQKQHERDWSQSKAGSIQIKDILHNTNSCVAATWTAYITMPDGQEIVWDDLRLTLLAEQEGGEWKIAHCHASAPSVEQKDGNSFPDRS